jgi:hypothetical protein
MKYRYTQHQVARGTRADAERGDTFYLLKNVSSLRLTYQIQLLTFLANDSSRKLVIRVPGHCVVHPTLRDFLKAYTKIVRIEKAK